MKKLLLNLSLIIFLVFSTSIAGYAISQYDYETEAAPDTLSVDDMDPELYTEDETAEEKECCPAPYIAIAVVFIAAGFLVYRKVTRKKKE